MTRAYKLATAPPARRALAERLPLTVAAAAVELITGALLEQPRRIGKPLGQELAGIYSARLARDYRVFYEVNETEQLVVVLDIRHRSVAYRHR